jgi:hypothetical protein
MLSALLGYQSYYLDTSHFTSLTGYQLYQVADLSIIWTPAI